MVTMNFDRIVKALTSLPEDEYTRVMDDLEKFEFAQTEIVGKKIFITKLDSGREYRIVTM